MKKWLISIAICVLVLVVSVALLLPLGMGFAVQRKYSEVLESLSQSEHIQMRLVSYQRGWFHSDAVVQVTLSQPTLLEISKWLGNDNPQGAVQFMLRQRIDHGPFLRVASQTGNRRLMLGRAVIKSSIKGAIGHIDTITLAELDGSLLSVINAPDLHKTNQAKGISAKVTGLTATLLLSADLNQMFASIDAPEGSITTPDFLQKISNLSEQFSLRKSPSGLYLGWRTTKIGDASWETADHKSRIQLNGLTMQSQSAEKSAKMTYKLNTILNKLVLDSGAYGPQQIKLSISDLDVPTLLALRRELTQITRSGAISASQLFRYNDLFMLLLGKGLVLNIEKLNLAVASGNFTAIMQVALKPQTTTATSLASFLNYLDAKIHLEIPNTLLTKLVTDFGGSTIAQVMIRAAGSSIPQAGAANANAESEPQAKQQIALWVQQKWLIPTDDSYLLDISYINQQLKLNGIPINKQSASQPQQQLSGSPPAIPAPP